MKYVLTGRYLENIKQSCHKGKLPSDTIAVIFKSQESLEGFLKGKVEHFDIDKDRDFVIDYIYQVDHHGQVKKYEPCGEQEDYSCWLGG